MAEDNLGLISINGFNKRSATIGGKNDTQDTFSFRIDSFDSSINVSLTEMSKNANLELHRDSNENGKIDSNEPMIGLSTHSGGHDEVLNLSSRFNNVNPGSYIVRVKQADSGKFRYNLKVSASATFDSNRLLVGETETTLDRTLSFNGSLSKSNTADTYRFQAPSRDTYSFFTDRNVDMRLIDDKNNNQIVDSGEVVANSLGSGDFERISLNLDSGEYYVQVYGDAQLNGSNNPYTLTAS